MNTRINILQQEPAAYKAFTAIETYLQSTGIDKTHKHLLKIRASQINGCAFCINMHTKEARKDGETEQRIYLLNAWKETSLYTEAEKAILALTEEMTLIHKAGVSDEVYNHARELLGDTCLSQIMVAIVAINAWNRIAITGQFAVA